MSKDEFIRLYRGRMLLFLTEAFAARKDTPTQLGMLADEQLLRGRALLGEMYDTLVPPTSLAVAKPPVINTNGQHVKR